MNRGNFRILIVDDERSFLLLLTRVLEGEGYTVKAMSSGQDALKGIASFRPNLVITDLKMPGIDGLTLLDKVKEENPETDFIMITAYATVDTAVSAMKKGAFDYITKPLKEPDQLRIAVTKVVERQGLLSENALLKAAMIQDVPPSEVLFAGMEGLLGQIRDVAPTDATVILYGETGTGKSVVAKVIHHMSGRTGPFVDLNCAAIPDNLLESELFGYEKGAFTGAAAQKRGKFEVASDGTIFLDEVSEMTLSLQAKFLKILQEKTFERLGSLESLKTNARVIAATNRNLREMVAEKRFREDLYYRLSVFPLTLPPLRDRIAHFETIAGYLVKTISGRLGKESKPIPEGHLRRLRAYQWPGNIRELENILERAIIVSHGQDLTIPDLGEHEPGIGAPHPGEDDLKSIERKAIESTLLRTKGNRRRAAEQLGISVRALQYKIKEYGISETK
jgi:DNA-binding NtrC family response regulator